MSEAQSTHGSSPVSLVPIAGSAKSNGLPKPTEFVGRSRIFRETLRQLERYAGVVQALVLLEGESGTGKSFFARYLHERSPRAAGPFENVVLPTLDDNLAPSELFGHVRGAYTDARQHRPGRFVSANG